jgi:glycosyltransferase involved in cell wall biosynthesis
MTARRRIALLSPFNPQRSGISDYSEELLPHLARHADVDIVTPPYYIANDYVRDRFRICSLGDFEINVAGYAGILYQIGNNYHHHAYMVPLMRKFPGVCVLHDYCLQYLILGLTASKGSFQALVDALQAAGREDAHHDALRLCWNVTDPERFELAPALLRMSRGAIVHSEYAAGLVRRDVPELPLRTIRMGVPMDAPATPQPVLRERYGIRSRDFVCASISTASRSKRLPLALRAIRRAMEYVPSLKFIVAGTGNIGDESRLLVRSLGLGDAVTFTGWLSAEDYRGVIALSDVAMDIRYPSAAETSASVTRALAAGRALIVSRQGSFTELPDDCCIKIPVQQPDEEQQIAGALVALAREPQRKQSMARASRVFAESLRLEDAGRQCVEFAVEVGCGSSPPWFQPWPLQTNAPRTASLVRLVYRATRSAYLFRHYGARDTLRRLRAEWAARGQAGATGL